MQAAGRGTARPPIGIAFEGDLGNRIDAVLAIAMLNGLTLKGEARRIALSVSRASLKAAQLADVVSAFYMGRTIAGPGGATGGNPDGLIGMPEGPTFATDAPPLAAILAKPSAAGTPQYTSIVNRVLDTADNAVLTRNMLLAQNDDNASVVVAGPATGLARLLALNGARPQVAVKVRRLVLAIGTYPSGPADPAITSDVAALRKVLADWPTPIVAVGADVGAALPYPAASIERDFAWAPAHPVVDAYRAAKPMPYDAPATALAALLFAVHPDDGFFKLSEPGSISVLDDGRTHFAASPTGAHRYLIVDPAQVARVVKIYTETVSSQPVPRPARGGRGNAAAAQPQQAATPPPAQATPPAATAPKPATP